MESMERLEIDLGRVLEVKRSQTVSFMEDPPNAIMIKNAGNVPATINTCWPFPPGDRFNAGSQTDTNLLRTQLKFEFQLDGISAPNPLIVIFLVKTRICK